MYVCVFRIHMYDMPDTQRVTYEYVHRLRHTVRLLHDEVMYVCMCMYAYVMHPYFSVYVYVYVRNVCMYVWVCTYAYVRFKGHAKSYL
jgi:hypothetical protein